MAPLRSSTLWPTPRLLSLRARPIHRTFYTLPSPVAPHTPSLLLHPPNSPGPIPSSPSTSRTFGQPLPSTHPHLLLPGQLTPGIPWDEYASRREKLMNEVLGDEDDGTTVVLMGARTKYMSGKIFYSFRQETNFWWLTGFEEPDSCLVLEKSSSYSNHTHNDSNNHPKGYKMTIFCRPKSEFEENWNGNRTGLEGAMEAFGADEAYDISHLSHHLHRILSSTTTSSSTNTSSPPIYFDPPNNSPISRIQSSSSSSWAGKKLRESLLNLISPPISSKDSDPTDLFFSSSSNSLSSRLPGWNSSTTNQSDSESVLKLLSGTGSRDVKSLTEKLEKMRWIKSDNEIEVMRRAAKISSWGHAGTMGFANLSFQSTSSSPSSPPSGPKTEYSLASHFQYLTSLHHSPRMAYIPVCATCGPGGAKEGAKVRDREIKPIHYTSNLDLLREGELVLFDAGCEWGGYASDITRTFPTTSHFTSPQRDLYQCLLETQTSMIQLCTTQHGLTMNELHRRSVESLRSGLKQLGFDNGMTWNDLERRLFPHFLSHPLGVDLHDVHSFQRNERLTNGMVLTIEPSIFVPPDPKFPKHFHNLAIRIEDEVVVRPDQPDVLSKDAPKEVEDVEKACQGRWTF